MSQSNSPDASSEPRSHVSGSERLSISFQTTRDNDDSTATSLKKSPATSGSRPSSTLVRHSSIQFAPTVATTSRVANDSSIPVKKAIRLPSPPPPSTYEKRVSFDTFDNKEATDLSFTLISKHKNYTYKRGQRVFLVGTDQNDYSEFALEWLVEELVEDGDEIVCLRVVEKDSKIASEAAILERRYKQEATELLDHIQDKNQKCDGKAISLILEFAVGKVEETIERMIGIYAPASLVVGTRGRSLGGIQGLLPGSVSKYCLQNSPVPVIVVRPQHKRMKKMLKRQANPKQGYAAVLEHSKEGGSGAFRTLAGQPVVEASQHEANLVAKAIGLPGTFGDIKISKRRASVGGDANGSPLSRVSSFSSEAGSNSEFSSPTGPLRAEDAEAEKLAKGALELDSNEEKKYEMGEF